MVITLEIIGYFSTMTQHFFGAEISYQFATMHTASYEFLMRPKESAECHQTLSSWVESGHETRLNRVGKGRLSIGDVRGEIKEC